MDNVIGTPASTVIVDFAIECMGQAGVDIVVISRKREGHEAKLLGKLVDAEFIELNCFQLDTGTSIELLQALGIVEPSDELVQLGQNLLNLEIIAKIRSETPDFCLNGVTDEIDLWNKLLDVIEEREVGSQDMTIAEDLVPMAAKLAREGLNQDDRTFMVNPPLSRSLKRLISWGMTCS